MARVLNRSSLPRASQDRALNVDSPYQMLRQVAVFEQNEREQDDSRAITGAVEC